MTSNLRRQSSKSHGALQEKKDHEDIFESVPQINGKEKIDDEDDDEGAELPQDIYSLVYSENRPSLFSLFPTYYVLQQLSSQTTANRFTSHLHRFPPTAQPHRFILSPST